MGFSEGTMKNNKVIFISMGILGLLGLEPRNLALENSGGLSEMLKTNISFILEGYPGFLKAKADGLYGEEQIEAWKKK